MPKKVVVNFNKTSSKSTKPPTSSSSSSSGSESGSGSGPGSGSGSDSDDDDTPLSQALCNAPLPLRGIAPPSPALSSTSSSSSPSSSTFSSPSSSPLGTINKPSSSAAKVIKTPIRKLTIVTKKTTATKKTTSKPTAPPTPTASSSSSSSSSTAASSSAPAAAVTDKSKGKSKKKPNSSTVNIVPNPNTLQQTPAAKKNSKNSAFSKVHIFTPPDQTSMIVPPSEAIATLAELVMRQSQQIAALTAHNANLLGFIASSLNVKTSSKGSSSSTASTAPSFRQPQPTLLVDPRFLPRNSQNSVVNVMGGSTSGTTASSDGDTDKNAADNKERDDLLKIFLSLGYAHPSTHVPAPKVDKPPKPPKPVKEIKMRWDATVGHSGRYVYLATDARKAELKRDREIVAAGGKVKRSRKKNQEPRVSGYPGYDYKKKHKFKGLKCPPGAYACYVKERVATLKAMYPNVLQKVIMSELGKEWRGLKAVVNEDEADEGTKELLRLREKTAVDAVRLEGIYKVEYARRLKEKEEYDRSEEGVDAKARADEIERLTMYTKTGKRAKKQPYLDEFERENPEKVASSGSDSDSENDSDDSDDELLTSVKEAMKEENRLERAKAKAKVKADEEEEKEKKPAANKKKAKEVQMPPPPPLPPTQKKTARGASSTYAASISSSSDNAFKRASEESSDDDDSSNKKARVNEIHL